MEACEPGPCHCFQLLVTCSPTPIGSLGLNLLLLPNLFNIFNLSCNGQNQGL